MKVEEIREVILRDSFSNRLTEGDVIIFRDKSDREFVAEFLGYEKGLLKLKNTTNETRYNVRVSSLVYTKIVDGRTENVEG